MIIGLTGLLAAGKGTIAKYLVDKYQAKTLRFSDPLRDAIKRFYHEPTREYMSHLGRFVRGEFGDDILIQTLLKDAANESAPIIILDGIRYFDEYEVLSNRDDFQMWAVDTEIKTRYERIIKRDENPTDKKLTFERFTEQHNLETEVNTSKLMAKADVKFDNNGSLDELYKQVDEKVKTF